MLRYRLEADDWNPDNGNSVRRYSEKWCCILVSITLKHFLDLTDNQDFDSRTQNKKTFCLVFLRKLNVIPLRHWFRRSNKRFSREKVSNTKEIKIVKKSSIFWVFFEFQNSDPAIENWFSTLFCLYGRRVHSFEIDGRNQTCNCWYYQFLCRVD